MPVHFDTAIERVIPGLVDEVEDKKYRVKWETDDTDTPIRAEGQWHVAHISCNEDDPSDFRIVYKHNSGRVIKEARGYRVETGDWRIRDTLRELDREDLQVWMPHASPGDKKANHTIEGCSLGGDRLITPWTTIYVRNPGVFYHHFTAEGFKVSVGYCIYMPDIPMVQVYACPDYTSIYQHYNITSRSLFNQRVKEVVAEHKRMVALREDGRDGEADLAYLRAKRDDAKRRDRLYKQLKARSKT